MVSTLGISFYSRYVQEQGINRDISNELERLKRELAQKSSKIDETGKDMNLEKKEDVVSFKSMESGFSFNYPKRYGEIREEENLNPALYTRYTFSFSNSKLGSALDIWFVTE